MEKITITEALSEVNLIKKKIIAKQSKIKEGLFRVEHLPDPFISEGGSASMIGRETQGIQDLNQRLARIRATISLANLTNNISISGDLRTIHDWLIWKREIAKDQIAFVSSVHKNVKTHMDQSGKTPQVYKDTNDAVQIVKYVYNLDYAQWLKHDEILNEKLEQLDGQLSLKNATILVEI